MFIKGIELNLDTSFFIKEEVEKLFKYYEEHSDEKFYEIIDDYDYVEFWNKRKEIKKVFKNVTIVSMVEHLNGIDQLVFSTVEDYRNRAWGKDWDKPKQDLEKDDKKPDVKTKKQKGLFEY